MADAMYTTAVGMVQTPILTPTDLLTSFYYLCTLSLSHFLAFKELTLLFWTGVQKKSNDTTVIPRRCSERARAGINSRFKDFITTDGQKLHYKKQSRTSSVIDSDGRINKELICDSVGKVGNHTGVVTTGEDPGGTTAMMDCDTIEDISAGRSSMDLISDSATGSEVVDHTEAALIDEHLGETAVMMTCDTADDVIIQAKTVLAIDDVGRSNMEMTCDYVSEVANQPGTVVNSEALGSTVGMNLDHVEGVAAESSKFYNTDHDIAVRTLLYPHLYCSAKSCNEEVFIACPLCLNILCYDHKETSCSEHGYVTIVDEAGFAHMQTVEQFITIVDDAGNEFQVEVEVEGNVQVDDNSNEHIVGQDSVPRKSRPSAWKRNVAKNCRNSGLQYTTYKGSTKEIKQIKPNPCRKCQHNCSDWTEEQRHQQFDDYWKLSYQQKRDWIVGHTELKFPKRKKGDTKRQYTIDYFMQREQEKVAVCRQFFLSTLDIGKRLVHYTVQNRQKCGIAKPDQRGRHNPANKTRDAVEADVMNFISKLPAVPSHYCRSRSSRKYLPVDMRNLSFVYKLYRKEREKKNEKFVSKEIFRRIFQTKFNIGFHHPKKDKCVQCERFKNTPENVRTEAMKQAHIRHEEEKNATYKEHIDDQSIPRNDKSVLCCSFDLQAVLATPRSDSVLLFYARKYATYNFTVYESVSRIGTCFVWGEADGRRGSNEIATCLHRYIMSVDNRQGCKIKHIVMYCDCCAGQNRNRIVLAMLKYSLSLTTSITEITLKFLLPGHTYMPADSMHATIERFTKKRAVWAPSQWATVISMARTEPGPYNVTVMNHTDFMD